MFVGPHVISNGHVINRYRLIARGRLPQKIAEFRMLFKDQLEIRLTGGREGHLEDYY